MRERKWKTTEEREAEKEENRKAAQEMIGDFEPPWDKLARLEAALSEIRALPDQWEGVGSSGPSEGDAGYANGLDSCAYDVRAILKKHGLEGSK